MILILSEPEVERLLPMEACIDVMSEALAALARGEMYQPLRAVARPPDAPGLIGLMPAYRSAAPAAFGLKAVNVMPGNPARGLDAHQGAVLISDGDTGELRAIVNASAITAIRTAAVSAVATRALARDDARELAILGAGVQGHSHLDALPRVRGFREIRVASRTPANAAALAALHPAARPVGSFEEAVTGADVVCCCTDTHQPVIRAAWLAPGAHVSSVGGIFGPELDADTVRAGRVFVEWRGAASNPPPAGAHELQGLDGDGVTELGEVLAGTLPGRTSDQEITVYKSTGHAVEDAAAARLVYERARQAGAGVTVTL